MVRGAVPRGARATECLHHLRVVKFGRFVLPAPARLDGQAPKNRRKALQFRGAATGDGEQPKATAVCSARSHRCTVRFRPLPSVVVRPRCSTEHRKSSHRDTRAVAGHSGFVPSGRRANRSTLFGAREPPRSVRWCQRRCDRGVWTRDPDVCSADAPLPSGRGRGLECVQPPAGGQK